VDWNLTTGTKHTLKSPSTITTRRDRVTETMNHPIILETPRLLLRKKVLEDAPFFMELNADPEVTKYTGDGAFNTLEEAENIVRYVIVQYEQNGYGRWMVLNKETREPLGWCGLKFHPEGGETDLGYRLMQKHWGKGYATEAGLACLKYGFEQLQLTRIVGRAAADNSASVRVLKKLGMTFFEDTFLDEMPAYIYHIKKENDV
jgi:ribosomal-protein-alanine N-acetyltransferase